MRRQRDLARGADAELVRDNARRYQVALGFMGLGFFLALLGNKAQPPSPLYWILVGFGGLSMLVGFLMALWAREESGFLSKPDSEDPPKIFKG
jgi:hypothetical protein